MATPWPQQSKTITNKRAKNCKNPKYGFVSRHERSPEAHSTPKPYEFTWFGAMDVTKPYEFTWFGAMYVTKPYEFYRVWGHVCHQTL